MREIKLRAKDTLTEEWIYSNGYYFDEYNYWFILPTDKPNVDKALAWTRHRIIKPETIGQFTGLRDKNGGEIYEGDILAGTLGTAGRGASTRREKPFNFQMMWYREGWNLSAVDRYCSSTYRWYPNADDCTIIGNIHENPELLK